MHLMRLPHKPACLEIVNQTVLPEDVLTAQQLPECGFAISFANRCNAHIVFYLKSLLTKFDPRGVDLLTA
jgi:hypothetical protein